MENFTRELEPIKTVKWMVLCGDLDGREIHKGGDMCLHMAGSLRCAAGASTTL